MRRRSPGSRRASTGCRSPSSCGGAHQAATPDQILARLDHHLDLLTAGARDLPERQQTLRGAIGWSYDLLDEGARRLVDRLSVFLGGFDLEMVERVCGPAHEVGGDVVVRAGELVDQSLVRLDEDAAEPRFAMLETIREYATEMLVARGEAEAIADRHAAAMLELAEQAAPELNGADQRAWLDRLEREHDNMRAASDWSMAKPDPVLAVRLAFALWRFRQQRGYLNEARARFEGLEAQGWSLDPELGRASTKHSVVSRTGSRTNRPRRGCTTMLSGSGGSWVTSGRSRMRSTTAPTPT